ncbi:MAG: putative amidohydrolase YtcJ [Saprospiraceae bacterium]|jgi:predicted amidohydrolase YtcJ
MTSHFSFLTRFYPMPKSQRGQFRRDLLPLTSLLCLLFTISSCSTNHHREADTIYYNGKIITMEGDELQYVEAVITYQDKIVKTGTLANLKKISAATIERIDLKGATMLPGFIEPHLHPLLATILIQTEIIAFNDWNLPNGLFPKARDQEEYIQRLDDAIERSGNADELFITWGYHELYHGDINRKMLDKRYPDRPVLIWQYSFHEVILNSAAVAFLNIDQEKAGLHHQVNLEEGRFFERGNQYFVAPKLFPIVLSPNRAIKGIQLTAKAIQDGGITTVADMAMPLLNLDMELNLVQQVLEKEDVPFRTFLIPMASSFAKTSEQLERAFETIDTLEKLNTNKIKFVKQIKLMADGAFYAQLMQMAEPYTDGHEGEWLTEPEEFKKYAAFFWEKEYRIHVHANGDKGVEMVLNTLEELLESKPKTGHRFTLHHLGYVREDQIDRMAKLGVHASIQPYYLYGIGSKYADTGLGKKRAQRISPVGSLIERDIITCFHSDFFMAPVAPLMLMWVAVNRKTMDGQTFGAELRVSPWEALKAVTINAAYHLNQEDIIGSIQAGKKADFVILEENPLDVDPEMIKDIEILGTVYEGRRFFSN